MTDSKKEVLKIINVSDIGTSSTAISSFVEEYYYSNGLTFLLLVGDIARLGMLRTFQQTRIYSKMDCVDNMQISVSHRKESKSSIFASRKGEIKEKAESLLEFVGLYSKRNLISSSSKPK